MSIKNKVIALLAVLASLYVVATVILIRAGMLPAFSSIEREFAEQNAERVSQFLQSELGRIDSFSIDWAQWTESRDYLLGNNPNYIDINLTEDAPSLINADVLAFFDTEANLVWGGVFEFESLKQLSMEDFFSSTYKSAPELFNQKAITASTTGLVSGKGPTMLLASRPVVDNNVLGPVAGTLLLGRVLDDRFLRDLQNNLSLDLSLIHVGSDSYAGDDDFFLEPFNESSTQVFVEDDKQTRHLSGYRDIYGRPALVVEVRSPRNILEIGRSTINTGITVLVAALLLFIFAIWYLLGFLILRPLGQLKNHMRKMQESDDLSLHIDFSRTDEFGEIAREFNELTSKLNDSKKESEEARLAAISASQAKSDFLATMSHEIRTPMNGVLGVADLLLATGSLTNEQRQYVNTINHSGSSLLKILNNILDFSKIEAGKFLLEDTEFNLVEVLEDAAELLTFEIQSKGLEFILALSPGLSRNFVGDVGRLRQIVLNLLSNAAKFTEKGFICLRASEVTSENGNYIQIEVEDSGIGIKEENKAQLFSSFTQEDASTTRKFGGTGLGLAVSKQLAELMGGEAGLESTFGEGSTFWIKIPFRSADEDGALNKNSLRNREAVLVSPKGVATGVLKNQFSFLGVELIQYCNLEDIANTETSILSCGENELVKLFVDEQFVDEKFGRYFELLKEKVSPRKLSFVLLSSRSNPVPDSLVRRFNITSILHKPFSLAKLTNCFDLKEEKTIQESQRQEKLLDVKPDKTEVAQLSVLLVEDNEVNQLVAKSMLEKLNCKVVLAINGLEAVTEFSPSKFDVVFMDCSMPEMDGYEATQLIREAEKACKAVSVPIIALTANAMEEDRQRCINAGMNDFLSKPVSLKAIEEKLEELRTSSKIKDQAPFKKVKS